MTKLWDWVERQENQREAARTLKMHFVTLNQILQGRHKPGLILAWRIQEHAGISAGIWLRKARTRVSRTRFTDRHNAETRSVSGL